MQFGKMYHGGGRARTDGSVGGQSVGEAGTRREPTANLTYPVLEAAGLDENVYSSGKYITVEHKAAGAAPGSVRGQCQWRGCRC